MPEELIMRGQTVSGGQETLNFGGRTPGYGFHLTQFQLYPSAAIASSSGELLETITADDIGEDPANPNFNHPGLIGTYFVRIESQYTSERAINYSVINDLFVVTQDLILMVQDASAGSQAINWQCKFKKVKLSSSAEAVANFNQFTIYDG